jgi:hypothetical protein
VPPEGIGFKEKAGSLAMVQTVTTDFGLVLQ